MATKKKQRKTVSVEKELKSTVKKLRAQLAAAEKSAEKWKSRAKAHQSDAKGAQGELTAVRRRLDKATASAAKWKSRASSGAGREAEPQVVPQPAVEPDATWTVTRLRAEARARGVAGYSRKTKDQLLAELRVGSN